MTQSLLRPPSARFTVRDLFALMDGETYQGEGEFQRAVIACFNANLYSFPPHYGYRDAITFAVKQCWVSVSGSSVTVSVPASEDEVPLLALAA